MTIWKDLIDLSTIFIEFNEEKITPKEVATKIAEELKKYISSDPKIQDFISDFEIIDDDASEEDIDFIMDKLYDFGDANYIWINTEWS